MRPDQAVGVDREHAGVAHLGGMWIAPEARGRGAGRALGETVLAWALARGFGGVVLWVTEGNKAAIALYERMGFVATGRRDRLPSDVGLETIEMRLTLPARTP